MRDTSLLTYEEIKKEFWLGERQIKVLEYIRVFPDHTDTEIARGLGYADVNKVRPRRNELLKIGLIEEGDKRRCRYTGRLCYTWRPK